MNLFRKLHFQFIRFFHRNYALVSLSTCLVAIITAYLHYQLKVNNNDLMHWKLMAENCTEDEYFQVLLLIAILTVNVIFIGVIVTVNVRPITPIANELSLVEIKDRYARFIILRLIARLDRIVTKLAGKHRCARLQHYARAHTNMVKAMALFRKDARKLLLPNESEIVMPIDVIYGVSEDEERSLRAAGYYKLPIDKTDSIVKSLFNPS